MNIIQMMSDPAIFGKQFGGDSFAAWRALLGGFYGSEGVDAEIFKTLTQRAPEGPYRELWMAIGRRGGKSQAAALIAVCEAALNDHSYKLAAGEVATVMVVAADRRQARTIFRYVKGLIECNPMLAKMVIKENADGIELSNRTVIEIGTANNRALRGYTISCAVLDEIAFWNDGGASPDTEIVRGLRPALATLKGPLIALSSPYAKRGVLYNTYRKHFGGNGKILVAQAPTLDMNPTIDPQVIADALEEDGPAARAEYLAEFRTDIEEYVPIETVEACIPPGLQEILPLHHIRYQAFVDPSGGSKDAMTLAIGHVEDDKAVVDCIRAVWPPFSPEAVVQEFAADLKRFNVQKVVGDRYAGEWPRERFRMAGIRYDPSAKPKSELYVDMLPLLNSQRAQLLDNAPLVKQIAGLERRTSRGGRDTIDHAPNGHDDLANAAAGLLSILTTKQLPYGKKINIRL
jgi:hypothetical protein